MTRNSLRRAFSQLDLVKQDKDYLIPAVLGFMISGAQTVDVPQRPGYVYARVRSNLNEVVQVFNDKVSPVYDLPVLLVRDPNNPTRYKVEGRDVGRYENWGTTSSYLPRHGNQHSFNPENGGGGDVTWVYGRQFMPLSVYPSGTAGAGSVIIGASAYYYGTSWRYAGGTGTPDLLVYKPTGSSARMVLVTLSPEGNPTINAGTDYFAASITGTSAIMPYIPALNSTTHLPLAAIRLVSGTRSVGWDNIYDVRPLMLAGYSTTTGTANGHIIQDDGSSLPAQNNLNFVGSGFVVYDGGGATNVSGTAAAGNFARDARKITLWDNSAAAYKEYAASATGLASALGIIGTSDLLWLPYATFTGKITFPSAAYIVYCDQTNFTNTGDSALILSGLFTIHDPVVSVDGSSTGTINGVVASGAGGNVSIYNGSVYAENAGGGLVRALSGAANANIYGGYYTSWDDWNGVYSRPFDTQPNGYYYTDYPNTGYRAEAKEAKFGSETNYTVLDDSGVSVSGTASTRLRVIYANTSNPPTDAELDSALGQPADVRAGYSVLLNDAGAGANEYLVVSDGSSWWYTALTKAL